MLGAFSAIFPAQVSRAIAQESKAAPAAAADPRANDRAAVRAAIDGFVNSFATRDAKALADHWTTEGELQNAAGLTVHGREKLERVFASVFSKVPEIAAEVRPQSLKFFSNDSAIEEGTVTIRRGAAEAATRAHYTVLVVREDGQWKLANLRETAADEASLDDLEWLIGEWKSGSGEGAEIRTKYSWTPSKKFIRADFTVKEKDRQFSGTQIIGVDPASDTIRSWTFEADGGIGEADWSRDGDNWELAADGTLADGSTLTETNILSRVNDDTFTWQSVDRELDDAELPELPPVKVTRIKAE